MSDYEHISDEDLAADALVFLAQYGHKCSAGDWKEWRVNVTPPRSRPEEERARHWLHDHDCVAKAPDNGSGYGMAVFLTKEGRAALRFKGGPKAYWEDKRQQALEARGANRAKISDTKWNKIFFLVNGAFALVNIAIAVTGPTPEDAIKEHEAQYHINEGQAQVSSEQPMMPADSLIPRK